MRCINLDGINEKLLNEYVDLTGADKEFARQVNVIREKTLNAVYEEIDSVIKKYARIEATEFLRLYGEYENRSSNEN